ncbi:MAG TPA: hypothetical protein VF070_39335 [Streptosporangiaceae bacterium]
MRKPAATRHRMTEAEIKVIVDKLADIARVLADAEPDDKAEIFRQLGLKLTYQPGRQVVEAEIRNPGRWQFDGVRGAFEPFAHVLDTVLTTEFVLDGGAR